MVLYPKLVELDCKHRSLTVSLERLDARCSAEYWNTDESVIGRNKLGSQILLEVMTSETRDSRERN